MNLHKYEEFILLPFVTEKTTSATVLVKNNNIGDTSAPIEIKKLGLFLLEPDDFDCMPSSF